MTEQIAVGRPSWVRNATGLDLLGFLLALAPFLAVLFFGVPSWFAASITLDTVTDMPGWNPVIGLDGRLLWSLVTSVGAVLLIRMGGRGGRWLALSLLLANLAISQAFLWNSGHSKYTLIGGLIPYTDANGYLDLSVQIFENHRVVGSFFDRPMLPAFVSSIFHITGLELKPVLGCLLFFSGVGMFVAAREVFVRFGAVVASCFLFVIHVYYNRTVGTLMTEHLGVALGLCSLPLLLSGFFERRRTPWLWGLFFLSAALCARAGAMFVLPALSWIAGKRFRMAGRSFFPMLAASIAVILIPFALNHLLASRVFDPATRPPSHFAYVAYGALRGTSSAEPMSRFLGDEAGMRAAMWQILKEKPHRVLLAIRSSLVAAFENATAFMFMGPFLSRVFLYVFLFAAALALRRATRSACDPFAVAVAAGIIASVPFAPPVECDWMRIYAATMPLQAWLVAMGVGALVRLVAPAFQQRQVLPASIVDDRIHVRSSNGLALGMGCMVLALVFALPIAGSFRSQRESGFARITKESPARLPAGFAIHLVGDDAPCTDKPCLRLKEFHAGLYGLATGFSPKEAAWLEKLPPGITLVAGGQSGVVIVPTEKLHNGSSRSDFRQAWVGNILVAVDRDIPFPEPPDPNPVKDSNGERDVPPPPSRP